MKRLLLALMALACTSQPAWPYATAGSDRVELLRTIGGCSFFRLVDGDLFTVCERRPRPVVRPFRPARRLE